MAATPQGRLIFNDFEFERFPNGLCRARVDLGRRSGDAYTATVEGSGSTTGALRCAAQASLAALEQAVQARYSFQFVGVKTVSAFDSVIVIVALAASREGASRRLVGSYVTEHDATRAAAIAVLNATNRLLANGTHRP